MIRRNLLTNAWLQLVLVFCLVIAANLWSAKNFTRLDLTQDRLYSLDLTTRALVHRVDKPLLTKVYFSEGLCHPHQNHKQRVVDTLEELQAYSHGLMDLQVLDPTANPELIAEAARFGVEPFQWEYSCNDREEKRDVYMGISMLYGDRQEVLPVVLDLERLEYDLARALKRLVTGEDPKRIGWATGNSEIGLLNRKVPTPLAQLRADLAQDFILQTVPLGGEGPIDESIDLLFVVEPRTTLTDRSLYQLDQFIMRGGAAAVFLTNYAPHPRAPGRAQRFYHGLAPLLAHYGVQVNRDILVDRKNHGIMANPTGQGAFKTPLIPEVKSFDSEHITVSNIESLYFPFASSLTLTELESDRMVSTVLAQTEATSGAIREIETVDPAHYQLVNPGEQRGRFPVLVALEGSWTSFYADKEIPQPAGDATPDDPTSKLRSSLNTRLVVGGSSAFVYFSPTSRQVIRNLADWMGQDESLIGIRSKTHALPTFEPPEPERAKTLKLVNLLGGLILLLCLGGVRWSLRNRPWATPPGGGDASLPGLRERLRQASKLGDTPWAEHLQHGAKRLALLLRPRIKTLVLLTLLGLTGSAVLWDRLDKAPGATELPVLPAVPRESIARVEITSAHEKIVLEQDITAEQRELHDLGTWRLTSPIEADADLSSMRSLVATFRKETPIDARLEQSHLADYGLDANNRIVVEVFTDSEAPALSYVLGFDVVGGDGASYIKLAGSNDVYRANIGGRTRFEKKGTDWRNRVLLGFVYEEVLSLHVEHQTGTRLDIHRNSETGLWEIQQAPAEMAVDQLMVSQIIQSLGAIRVGAFLGRDPSGFDSPLATARIVLEDDSIQSLAISSEDLDGSAKVQFPDTGEVFQVARGPIVALLTSADDLEDRTIFRFNPNQIDTLEYQDGAAHIRIQQEPGIRDGIPNWVSLIPANYSLELKRTFFMKNTLAELRADERSELSLEEAGLLQPSLSIKIVFLDGTATALLVGSPTRKRNGTAAWFVSVSGSSQVFVISDSQLRTLQAGFSRG